MNLRSKSLRIIAVCLAPIAAPPLEAQCVRVKIKADRFRGNVYLDKQVPPHPIANASVILSKTKGGNRTTVVELFTDGQGRFEADGIRPGKYMLEVRGQVYLDPIVTELTLVGGRTARGSSFLKINLGATSLSVTDSCEGDVIVSKRPGL